MRTTLRARIALLGIALAGVLAIVATPAAAAPIRIDTSSIPAGTVIEPALDCTPGPGHPHPVVVLPGADGTTDHTAAQWNPMLTALRADGGCAFLFQGGIIKGQRWAGDVPSEARQVADFVTRVRAATGADKVDIVAHSAGAFVTQYYLKVLHGAPFVRDAVLLAPESRGCDGTGLLTQYGITNPPMTPVQAAEVAPYLVSALTIMFPGMAPAMQMSPTSEVYKAVFDSPVTQPGVHYSVLATRNDHIATPAVTCSLLTEPGVVNVVYEDRFPTSPAVDHSTLRSSPATTAWVIEQLHS
ncbi:esterase/lipase family protein [Nocardia macrotermitis]|uniref:Lipase n=1 Tax=Nocardia macrotermitis TaxID=2585198 RepID=A0A7K0D2P4_9NOCA|nr:hypothetical protein [Nocardia macrotermitis]MQY19204.1 hypothetical protein [Nocardia macrotermitis]